MNPLEPLGLLWCCPNVSTEYDVLPKNGFLEEGYLGPLELAPLAIDPPAPVDSMNIHDPAKDDRARYLSFATPRLLYQLCLRPLSCSVLIFMLTVGCSE